MRNTARYLSLFNLNTLLLELVKSLLILYGHACKLQYLHIAISRLRVEHFGAYTSVKDFTVYSLDDTDCSDKQC
jgi:hypothetical protein